jgi:phosphoglycolate phosphatase-like HAD superfamily hydrolase
VTTSDTLLLFDIDGTLVTWASREHANALRQAVREVHDLSEEQASIRVDAAGRTDGEIARLILLQAGVDARTIDERAADVRAATCERYAQLCPADLSDRVIDGIPGLLASLAQRPGVRLSLVTGNFEPVARLKLRRAGLGAWFPAGQGGFGSDSEDRTVLPGIARRRAGERGAGGAPFPREGAIVIGDTPRDIACARADGVRCVAVATGRPGIEELGEADAVAAGGPELARVLDALLG